MNSWARRLRDSRSLALVQVFALVVLMLTFLSTEAIAPESADAYSAPASAWTTPVTGATDTSTSTPQSGLVTTITTAGATDLSSTTTLGNRGFDVTQFTPTTMVAGDFAANVLVNTGSCAATGPCSNLGTVTLSFSHPVRNPTIHLSGLGQVSQTPSTGTVTGQSDHHAVLDLTSGGATLTKADGNSQLAVSGNRITTTNDSAGYNCTTNANSANQANQLASAATAGCGSVLVTGTVSTLSFNVSSVFVKNGAAPAAFNSPTSNENFAVAVTFPEDFSDAPASYTSPSHVIGGLALGATVDEENQNVRNAVTSPIANAAANGDGADDDAFGSMSDISVANSGRNYSLVVPVSGVSKTARLCGFIDWNKGGTFTTNVGERACADVAPGATTGTLTWAVPAGLTVGQTYARFRLGYTAAQVESMTDRADSGEVEDYVVNLVAAPLDLAITAGAMTGPDSTGNYSATYAVTVTNPSTPGAPYGPITVTPGFNSNLTISGAAWTGRTPGSATGAGPFTLAAANTNIAPGATHNYNLTITFRYTGTGTATACGAAGTGLYVAVSLPSPQETGVTTDNRACLAAPAKPASALTLDKQASAPSANSAGSTITYTFVVRNSGTVPLTGVAVTDPKVGVVTCPDTSLVAGASMTCTKPYTITQADVEAGSVTNSASASGTPPTTMGLSTASATDTAVSTITRTAAISLDKQASSPSGNSAGSTIDYTFLVTNTGNRALSQVGVLDPKLGAVSCPVSTLAPGAATTCAKSYVVTQADVNAGTVANTATATGTPLTGAAVTSADSVSTSIARTAGIALDKQSGGAQGTSAGSLIAYSFLVTNTGNTTLTGVAVSDPKAGAVTCPVTMLAPSATTTCTKNYSLTQADIDAGHVANTATAVGAAPSGLPAQSATDSTDTAITAFAAITLDKQAAAPTSAAAGATIAYSFVVRNSGNVTLSAVGVSDPKVGPVTCPVSTLAPNATTTCSKSYVVTQADVDAGAVTNSATATGTPSAGSAVIATDSVTTTIVRNRAITLDKQAGPPSGATPGATIAYSFVVRNTGNVTLNPVSVSDPKVGAITCPITNLAPGVTTTCAKSYTLTQGDLDSGHVANTATATGVPPSGLVAPTATDSTDTAVATIPRIALDKQGSVPTGNSAGSTITYSFVVTNVGNATLTQVGVTDPKVGAVTCPATTLAPSATTTCSKTYSLTQTDVDGGTITNTATASGTPQTGPVVTSTDSVTTTIPRTAGLTLDKQAGTPTGASAGSTIAFTFKVSNTGNVTINQLSVSDPKVGAITCPVTSLAPGATTTCAKSYSITQADVDAGHVPNTATATGAPPSGLTAPTASDSTDTLIGADARITLDKQSTTPGTTAGSTVRYFFVVTNSGNVTISNIGVSDPKVGAISCAVTTIAPAVTTTCTRVYTLTQADVDAGFITSTATATGTAPGGSAVTASDSDTVTIVRTPAIGLDKRAGTLSAATAGATISYTFIVTNSGNVTLNPVSVSDPLVGSVTCPATNLAPGASTTCAKTYTVTQTDVDSGHIANTATAGGTPPSGVAAPSATDSTDTTIASRPQITIDKSASAPSGNSAGSTIAYSFLLANSGNVTLTSIGVADPRVGPVDCPVTTLAPGAATTCGATYSIRQADVDAGEVKNTATVTGSPPTGIVVTAVDSVTTPIVRATAITLDKQSGGVTDGDSNGPDAGDVINYSFVVGNLGNTTLTSVSVSDPRIGPVSCPVTTLLPDALTTCAKEYTLTQRDVDFGHVSNRATATGTPPTGLATPSAEDSTDTPITPGAGITLEKKAGGPSGDHAGATIDYEFVVSNPGNVTLSGLTVSDSTVSDVACPVSSLAPTESTTCTAAYTLTQSDVDAGSVTNTATASGTPPSGPSVSATDSVTSIIERTATVALDKRAGTPTGITAGSTIGYEFVVMNTGNVTLAEVSVFDDPLGPITCPSAVLAPAESETCVATRELTQADVDSGHFANSATVTATPPTGLAGATARDATDTPITPDPAVNLDAVADTPTGDTEGSTINYTFEVTNPGNVTMDEVSVEDTLDGPVLCPVTTLAPQDTMTCTNIYTLTQADVDAGEVINRATASGTPPSGDPLTATSATTTTIAAAAAVTLDKQAGAPTGNVAGSSIDYTFTVTNTGNVSLTEVAVSDPTVAPAEELSIDCPETDLAPADTTSCSVTYTLTQKDVDAGHIANTATVTASPPIGDPIESRDDTDTPIAGTPALTMDKTADSPTGNAAGATIDYDFTLTNTGNVTLDPVSVSDSKVGEVTCPQTALSPNDVTACAATYTVTQADVDAGHVTNTATATGVPPTGLAAPIATDVTNTPLPSEPAITIDKVAGTPSGVLAGSTIGYEFTVTNTGNVTLNPVRVDDPRVGSVDCPETSLAPSVAMKCTSEYVLTQADINAGTIVNWATASGTPPQGDPVSASNNLTTELVRSPAIEVDKRAASPSGDLAESTIDYTFIVTNTGNVTLNEVAVSDPLVDAVDCRQSRLLPGARTICNATYIINDGDVGAGHVENVATASGTPPAELAPVTASDTTDSTIAYGPTMSLDLQAVAPQVPTAGSAIEYTYTITNTGDFDLSPITLEDTAVGTDACSIGPLAPSDSTTCTTNYTLSQAEIDAGYVENDAITTGQQLDGITVTATDFTLTPLAANPLIALDKQAGAPSAHEAGGVIDYTFVVTNAGNVTLSQVSVSDPIIGSVECPDEVLAPAASTACTASYELTQADVDAGHFANSATAQGTSPTEVEVTSTDGTDTPVTSTPQITLDKRAGDPSGNTAGATIDFEFVVTNAGNVTLDPVTVDDSLTGEVSCPESVLNPSASTTCLASYTLTQADVDAGNVRNEATASGIAPSGEEVAASDATDTPIESAPGIALDKQASTPSGGEAGATIDYTLLVTNSGNVTLDPITVSDPLVGDDVSCPVSTLAPNQDTTCTATYTLTQDDVDAGEVVNVATVSGTPPSGDAVTAEDTVTTAIPTDQVVAMRGRGIA